MSIHDARFDQGDLNKETYVLYFASGKSFFTALFRRLYLGAEVNHIQELHISGNFLNRKAIIDLYMGMSSKYN